LADLTNVPTGYYAAPVHLRTVLHSAAVIILMTDRASRPTQRIGYGFDHTLDHFSQRRRDAVALGDQNVGRREADVLDADLDAGRAADVATHSRSS